jgi:hypothetical protein
MTLWAGLRPRHPPFVTQTSPPVTFDEAKTRDGFTLVTS